MDPITPTAVKTEGKITRKMFCVFCYKEANHSSNLETVEESLQDVENACEKFFKLASRHLGVKRKVGDHSFQNNDLECCSDCFEIIACYCELYHEIKCLELRLNWQIEKLGNVMRFADRVPSRFKPFRKWYYNGHGSRDAVEGVQSNRKLGLISFRNDFKRKCKLHKSRSLPSILLNSCDQRKTEIQGGVIGNNEIPAEAIPPTTSNPPLVIASNHLSNAMETDSNSEHKTECFLAWVSSLAALVFLFHLDPGRKQQQNHVTSIATQTEVQNLNDLESERILDEGDVRDDFTEQIEIDSMSMLSYSEESSHSEESETEDHGEALMNPNISLIEGYNEPKSEIQHESNSTKDPEQRFSTDNNTGYSGTHATNQRIFEGVTREIDGKITVEEDPFPYQYEEDHSQYKVAIITVEQPAYLQSSSLELQEGLESTAAAVTAPNNHKNCNASMNEQANFPKTPTTVTQKSIKSPVSSPTSERRRGLRQVFQCPVCKGTFSSSTRLENHKSEFHSDSNDMDISDDDDDGAHTSDRLFVPMTDDTDWTDKGNATASQNKSLKESDWKCDLKAESDSDQESSSHEKCEEEMDKKHLSITNSKRLAVCTKCTPTQCFSKTRTLHRHNDYFHSNGHVSMHGRHLPKSLTIQHLKLDSFPSERRHHPCPLPKCGKLFSHLAELDNHNSVFHTQTNLVCTFCDLAIDSPIDLINHELDHSDAKQRLENKNFKKGELFVCGRCDERRVNKMDFINHYLKYHLELPTIQATCPICNQTFKNKEYVPLTHYVSYHDLARLKDPVKPFRCTSKDPKECSAYFLTEDQLHIHRNRFHCVAVSSLEEMIASTEKAETKRGRTDRKKLGGISRKCPHCSKTFKSPGQLRMHVWALHGKGKDLKRRSAFYRRKLVISHPEDGITIEDLAYDKKAKYFCCVENCERGFMDESDLMRHSKLHGEFKCNYCNVVKKFAPELSIHETVHSDIVGGENVKISESGVQYAFRCLRCPFVTQKKTSYIEHHVQKHLGLAMDKRRCPICKYVYPWNMMTTKTLDLMRNMMKHYAHFHDLGDISKKNENEGQQVYKCGRDGCKAYFRTSLQFSQHVMEMHDKISIEDRLKCPDCGKRVRRQQEYREHRIRVHGLCLEDFRFTCKFSECKERFEKQIDLDRHVKYFHEQCQEQVACPIENCGKLFWCNAALRTHLKCYKHSGGNPMNMCEECGKSFKLKAQLETHMQFHAGPETWKYSCSVCNKKIISQQKLNEHMRTHTKEKPFVCQVCGVSYAHRHNLRIHVNNKHGLEDIAKKYDRIHTGSSRKGKKFK